MLTVKDPNSEQRLEMMLENLIRIQGSLNAKMDQLNRRLSQVENTLQQLPQQDPFIIHQKPILTKR